MYAILADILFAMTSFAGAEPDVASALALPVACTPGQTCLIQKLFDHDAGPGRRDYRCGVLTTDGHDGTDIRLRTMADMRAGVPVVAARAGVVLRTRDGEPDAGLAGTGRAAGKDAGNAVVIGHGDGWETQYSHLRRGSLLVRPGQTVARGQAIAMVGLSGNTEFPHLHFTVRHDGVAVDPFVGVAPLADCESDAPRAPLWSPIVVTQLGYVPTGVVAAGLASDVPPSAVVDRDPPPALRGAHAPLVLWADTFGARAGDRQEFAIIGPDGKAVHSQALEVEKGGLSWFAYSGKRPSAAGWAKGRYVGRYRLLRGSTVAAEIEVGGVVQ